MTDSAEPKLAALLVVSSAIKAAARSKQNDYEEKMTQSTCVLPGV